MGEQDHVSQVNLRLEGAGKRFERGWIFRNLNFCGQEGERWAIKGPNGSGKSTLLLSMGGYLELTEGGLSFTHANRTRPRWAGQPVYCARCPLSRPSARTHGCGTPAVSPATKRHPKWMGGTETTCPERAERAFPQKNSPAEQRSAPETAPVPGFWLRRTPTAFG